MLSLLSKILVKIQKDHNYISKTSSNINQLVYYLPKLYMD